MTAEQFFYLVKQMRQAQREYFAHRDQMKLRACKALEGDVDREILRVMDIIHEKERGTQEPPSLLSLKSMTPGTDVRTPGNS